MIESLAAYGYGGGGSGAYWAIVAVVAVVLSPRDRGCSSGGVARPARASRAPRGPPAPPRRGEHPVNGGESPAWPSCMSGTVGH